MKVTQLQAIIDQLQAELNQLQGYHYTILNAYRIDAITLSINYLISGAAVLDSMEAITSGYRDLNNN
jgi:hypothetical protein